MSSMALRRRDRASDSEVVVFFEGGKLLSLEGVEMIDGEVSLVLFVSTDGAIVDEGSRLFDVCVGAVVKTSSDNVISLP